MRKNDDPAIPSPDDVLQAEAFSQYFIKKVDGIRQCFHVAPDPDYVAAMVATSMLSRLQL